MPYAPHGTLTLAGCPPGATLTIHAPGSMLKEHRHEHPFMTVLLEHGSRRVDGEGGTRRASGQGEHAVRCVWHGAPSSRVQR